MLAIEELTDRLDEDDDPELWQAVLRTVIGECDPASGAVVEVGRCSHWLRPHQTRWKAGGGFAWPTGYGSGGGGYSRMGLPQFDWSIILGWDGAGWEIVPRRSLRTALRVAIPSRTGRHPQAAVHAVWHTGREKRLVFYGFHKRAGGWVCTASG